MLERAKETSRAMRILETRRQLPEEGRKNGQFLLE